MARKQRLFTPGPTAVPESIRLAMAQPTLHHRSPAFVALFAEVRAGLAWIFQTEHEVLTLVGSGTAAMDGAVTNLLSPGDAAVYVNGGKFGERWGEVLRAYGIEAIEVRVPWGTAVTAAAVDAALRAHPRARAVYLQACETSTAVRHPVAEVAARCRDHADVLCVVDAITALAVDDVALDRDGIDVMLGGSQKALMLPPGLAFVAMSPRAWARQAQARLPRFYLDFATERAASIRNQSAWTAAVSLVVGLRESLAMLRAEGLAEIFARHGRLAAATRAGLTAMGCTLYADAAAAARGVTAARLPAGIDPEAAIVHLAQVQGVTMVGGQDAAKGQILRLAHMGDVDGLDVMMALAALEVTLVALGATPRPGAGVGAARIALA